MRRFLLLCMVVLGVVLATVLAGCDGKSTPPAIAVAVAPSAAQTIDQGQTKAFTATVSNDPANAGVSWAVSGASCTGAACGTLTNSTTTSVSYNAPAAVAANLVITLTATSVSDSTKSASVTVTVTPPPTITTNSLPDGTVGVAYSATLQESGGVPGFTWSITAGTLPAGLTLNASTGAITGTPTTAGTSNFTVQVTDSGSPALSDSKALSITTHPPPLTVTTSSLPAGDVNLAYSTTLATSGGTPPATWSITVGALPGGLLLNAATGQISGVPTTAGTFDFTVQATDSGVPAQNASKALSIVINAQLTVTTTTLPDGTQGAAYNSTLASSGGTGAVTWSVIVGSLPAGLTLNVNTGAISGTPTGNPGTTNFTVQATDSLGQMASQALSITINAAPLNITTTSLPNGTVGAAYNSTVQATGGTQPYTWTITVGTLPTGLLLNAATGGITGTPTTPGTSNFTVHVVDSSGPSQSDDQALSITVNSAGPNDNLLNGTYAFQFTGWDADGSMAMAGSFAANGAGGITAGTIDVARLNTRNTNVALTGGSFTIGADRRGTLTLNSSLGVWTFKLAINSTGTQARFIQFDASGTRGSGVTKKQQGLPVTLAALNGDYAFGIAGYTDPSTRMASTGALTHNGSGSVTGGSLDASTSGASTGQITITGGTVGAPGATTGRGTLAINATIPGLPATLNFAYYIVSASELFLVNIDAPAQSVTRFSGSALKQNKPGGGFALASFNGTAIFMQTGFDISHTQTNVAIGQVVANGSGSITSASLDQNADGAINTGTSTGSYTMASSGRGVVSIIGLRQQVIYLVDANKGFILEGTTADPGNDVGLGFFEPQTGGPFTNASLSGQFQFATTDPATTLSGDIVGVVTANSAASPPFNGTTDSSDSTPSLDPDRAFTATYSTNVGANGRAAITVTPSGQTPVPLILWIVSPNKFVAIVADASDTDTAILIFEK